VRAVIDTNVLLSGLLWRGAPHRLIEAVRAGALTLITSPALLAELGEVVHRPKFHTILPAPGPTPSGCWANCGGWPRSAAVRSGQP
jgi:uncharacterized protein